MTPRLDFPHGVNDDRYAPAFDAYNLAQARAMLDALYGVGLDTKPLVGGGECADCSREAALLA